MKSAKIGDFRAGRIGLFDFFFADKNKLIIRLNTISVVELNMNAACRERWKDVSSFSFSNEDTSSNMYRPVPKSGSGIILGMIRIF